MGFVKEFKEFIAKGSVLDLAVGVIIGASFGKIVTSLVSDVIMPPIGLLMNGVSFVDKKIVLSEATKDASGKLILANTLNYGHFISVIFEFLIIALVIFSIIKVINRVKNEPIPETITPVPSKEETLLMEIRDLLRR